MNLTEKSVSKVTPGKERVQYHDKEVTGFGVRVESAIEGGRKSFFWRAKINGTQVFRALGEFPSMTVAEARTAARIWAGKASTWKQADFEGVNPFVRKPRGAPAGVPTFSELVEAYIANQVQPQANNPQRAEYQVRWMVKRHFSAWLDRKLDKITVEDVLTVKNACGKRRYLANRAVEFVRSLFNWSAASRDGKINFWRVENPAKDVESFDEKPREEYLQPAELLRFNTALDEETHVDLRDFLVLAMNTAARRGDILSMRWQDVKFEQETWVVPFPKAGESYNVQLLPAALDVLKRRDAEKVEGAIYVFPGVGASGHLIELKKPWDAFRKRAAIPHIRVHSLRRTVASYMAMNGVSLQQIAAALGHRSMQSTLIYAKLADESTRGARETGQRKMLEMMKSAKRRAKLTDKPKKLLSPKHPERRTEDALEQRT
jgi:integrase